MIALFFLFRGQFMAGTAVTGTGIQWRPAAFNEELRAAARKLKT